ncbi:MAG: hypothetical protein DRH44_07445 [Candidatus Coatesbacteria bacterium]|nr:MAG: hypothetical protein DRH44_07445 [Candidatus Coatesbacteria bacterium]RLC42934.1 MAG: hypothetical protein DRH49_02675 [Candidatus Coatesbacteria bacterium]
MSNGDEEEEEIVYVSRMILPTIEIPLLTMPVIEARPEPPPVGMTVGFKGSSLRGAPPIRIIETTRGSTIWYRVKRWTRLYDKSYNIVKRNMSVSSLNLMRDVVAIESVRNEKIIYGDGVKDEVEIRVE